MNIRQRDLSYFVNMHQATQEILDFVKGDLIKMSYHTFM